MREDGWVSESTSRTLKIFHRLTFYSFLNHPNSTVLNHLRFVMTDSGQGAGLLGIHLSTNSRLFYRSNDFCCLLLAPAMSHWGARTGYQYEAQRVSFLREMYRTERRAALHQAFNVGNDMIDSQELMQPLPQPIGNSESATSSFDKLPPLSPKHLPPPSTASRRPMTTSQMAFRHLRASFFTGTALPLIVPHPKTACVWSPRYSVVIRC